MITATYLVVRSQPRRQLSKLGGHILKKMYFGENSKHHQKYKPLAFQNSKLSSVIHNFHMLQHFV